MLDLNEVAMFVEVVRAGSFAAAGRRLNMPPNSVSRNVAQLEERLGSRLMQRSTRKLSLTAAGQTFFERCSRAVTDLWEAGEELAVSNEVPGGLVRVAAPADFFDSFQIEWVAEFMAAHPQVRLEFALSDARADLIAEGIDLAFRGGPVEEATVVARKLVPVHFGLVASPAYVKVRGAPANLRELARHECLNMVDRSGPLVWRLDGPKGPSEVRVSGRFAANTARAVLQAALAGLGIAYLPAVVTTPDIEAGRLVHVLPEYRREGRGMYAVLPSRRQIPRAVSAFVDFAAAKFAADRGPRSVRARRAATKAGRTTRAAG